MEMLPPEVWRTIAGHLSMREWAQVAGTCKTTWKLQLDTIDIAYANRYLEGD